MTPSDISLAVVVAFTGNHAVIDFNVTHMLENLAQDVVVCCVGKTGADTAWAKTLVARWPDRFFYDECSADSGDARWQAAVDLARSRHPRVLATTRPGHLMSRKLVDLACNALTHPFNRSLCMIGVRSWYVYQCDGLQTDVGTLYSAIYPKSQKAVCLEACRFYTAKAMDSVDWALFDTADGAGPDARVQSFARDDTAYYCGLAEGPVLNIKGPWTDLVPSDETVVFDPIPPVRKHDALRSHFGLAQTDVLPLLAD